MMYTTKPAKVRHFLNRKINNSLMGKIYSLLVLAMFNRSKKKEGQMNQYYIVIGAFLGVCVLSILYVLLNPKKSFASMPVIDESAILVHNG